MGGDLSGRSQIDIHINVYYMYMYYNNNKDIITIVMVTWTRKDENRVCICTYNTMVSQLLQCYLRICGLRSTIVQLRTFCHQMASASFFHLLPVA